MADLLLGNPGLLAGADPVMAGSGAGTTTPTCWVLGEELAGSPDYGDVA